MSKGIVLCFTYLLVYYLPTYFRPNFSNVGQIFETYRDESRLRFQRLPFVKKLAEKYYVFITIKNDGYR